MKENNILQRFTQKMNTHYEFDFPSEEETYRDNRDIKKELVQEILKCQALKDMETVKNGLELLLENTGCVEDFEILEEIILPHVRSGKIDRGIFLSVFSHSPINRWL